MGEASAKGSSEIWWMCLCMAVHPAGPRACDGYPPPPEEAWAIVRARKRGSAQSAGRKLGRQWPERPQAPFCHE